MYNVDRFITKVKVNLDNGLYRFYCESATGKSYLCKLLKQYREAREYVAAYSYQDKVAGLPIESVFYEGVKLVMFDRCDLYDADIIDVVQKHYKDTIILLDIKNLNKKLAQIADLVFIDLGKDYITVSE